jgi:acetyl-CoA carboxylase carboxyl transferase subunit beta
MAPTARPRVADLLDTVLDAGTWRSWDAPVTDPPVDAGYAADLARARSRTGRDESVVTGDGWVGGHRIAVAACEFDFLAGSIGVAAGERLCRAVERATAERLPLLGCPASGGTRMQEGTPAFVEMVKVAGAIADHRAAGLPYLVYLRHPTTGGAYASWGSLGQVTFAEPGALIAFLGPRVYESLHGRPFPPGVQVAENLYAHGLVDAVVPAGGLAPALAGVLRVTRAGRAAAEPVPGGHAPDGPPVEESIRRSRRPDRPGAREFLDVAARDVTALHGTGAGEADPAVLLVLARLGEEPCVVVAQDRHAPPPGPAGLRTARRGMRLAAEWGLPLLTLIDTAGAALSVEAEQGGLAGEIARCVADLLTLPVPTVSVLLGQGAGGGALALLPADRTVAARHAWLSPLPPEGAATILYRTAARTAEAAGRQGIAADRLRQAGIVDHVVAERPDAAEEPAAFLHRLAGVLRADLAALAAEPPADRIAARRRRYRSMGRPGP